MINECFVHCQGIGKKTVEKLNQLGFRNWNDCFLNSEKLPFNKDKKEQFLVELEDSIDAYRNNDIDYFVSTFPNSEHWRILGEYYSRATYFDIETTGFSWNLSKLSVITAYKNNEIFTFIYDDNLDDFLEFIEESELLVSFNGSSFDIPFIEQYFHIPSITCPHIDLRWIAYHLGYDGGLKIIEDMLGIKRPGQISDIDGYEAINLFHRWQGGDEYALKCLVNYCSADTISTYLVALNLLEDIGFFIKEKRDDELFKKAMDAYQGLKIDI